MDCGVILNQLLTKIGGSRIDDEPGWGNFGDPRVVEFLLKYGKEFPTEGLECLKETRFPDHQKSLDPGNCHKNCLELRCYVRTGRSEYRLVHGWALSDAGTWYCHSWCIKTTGPENITETTHPRIAYFGFVVPDEINPLAIWIFPSSLGDLLENWRKRFGALGEFALDGWDARRSTGTAVIPSALLDRYQLLYQFRVIFLLQPVHLLVVLVHFA